MVPFSLWRALQSNSRNCECLKFVWNVYCVTGITNHGQDLQPQKTKKHVEFPLVMEQICSISKGLKIDPLFQNEFSAGIPVISNARILSLPLLHVLACCNYALIVIG